MKVLRAFIISACSALALITWSVAASPSHAGLDRQSAQGESRPIARKFREFNPAEVVEAKAPFDFFYNELLTLPNAQAYIIFYRGRRRTSWQDHRYAKSYLDNRGGIPPDRIKAVFGGYRDDTAMELWIVPEGAELPKPTPTYFPRRRRKH
jgi:hypothetical protein